MKILADENIPQVQVVFANDGDVQTYPGRALTAEIVKHADVLLVRSVTQINAQLLQGSSVKFVATATAGTDHVDRAWLAQAGIGFAHAPGSNANSVAEYVLSAVLALNQRYGFDPRGKVLGIVGCGHVGARVQALLTAIGMRAQVYDPPLQELMPEAGRSFVDFETVLQSDIVTLHVPLTEEGFYPTYHMVEHAALQQLKPDAILINTSRGEVIDGVALQQHLLQQARLVVLDVWEHEPHISKMLLDQVALGTPHIAGYSFDAKLCGVRMIRQAFLEFFKMQDVFPSLSIEHQPLSVMPDSDLLKVIQRAVHTAYDVQQDDQRLRVALRNMRTADAAVGFDRLRKQYPMRREFSAYSIRGVDKSAGQLLSALGFWVDGGGFQGMQR